MRGYLWSTTLGSNRRFSLDDEIALGGAALLIQSVASFEKIESPCHVYGLFL